MRTFSPIQIVAFLATSASAHPIMIKETENLIYFLFGAAFMGFAYIGLTVLGCCYNKLRRRRNAARPRGQIPLTIRNPTFNRAHLGNPEYPKNFSKF